MIRTRRIRRTLGMLGVLLAFSLMAGACSSSDDGGSTETTAAGATETTAAGATETTAASAATTTKAPDGGEQVDNEIRLGILSACEGAFGAFNEDLVSGAVLALINEAGATSNSRTTSLEGFSGAEAGGLPINLVGIGCGNDTSDRMIQEVRRLVEQENANVVVGPQSGDESIAVANYAKDHPEVTFINGVSGAYDPTMLVQAPNYFRFNGDGAQWAAGLGDRVFHDAGWKTAAVIADDYSFGWSSAAGFIAEFCAVGGDVVTRVFPPLGTTDYSSFIQQLPDPDEVDGYYWAVGGTGTNASLEAFVNAKGDLTGDQHAGNLFFSPNLASALGDGIAGAYAGGFASLPPDISTPEIAAYLDSANAAWDTLAGALSGNEPAEPSLTAGFGFAYGYYSGTTAMIRALNEVNGDLTNNHEALRAALSASELDLPYGMITLDENRQAIADTSVQQLVLNDAGEVVSKTVSIIPAVDQSFGGTFSPTSPPPDRENPKCEVRDLPWVGNAINVVDGVPQP